MSGESLGSAWYELSLRDDEFRAGIKNAESALRSSSKGVEGLSNKLNTLRGRGPEELATSLARATTEADEATAAVRKLDSAGDLDTARARKYADQLNEISIEADQTRADLMELAAADPRFDTPELQKAASELDRVGREASEAAGDLNRMKGVGADTHLERLGQEAKEASGGLDKTGKSSDGLMTKLSSVKGVLAGLGIAIGAQQVLSFFSDAVGAASELEQSTRGLDRVLGEHSGTVKKFGETSAESWGLSRREVTDTATVLAAQLKGVGFSTADAAGEVVKLQQRAADLASTFGGPTSQAVQAISALLRGERDTIEKYGVTLKEADVQARILSLGLDTSTAAAKANATAIASLDLLMERTADSQGAFADNAGKAAGQQAILTAQLDDLSAEIGEKLLPVMVELATFANETLVPALMAVVDNAEAIGETIGVVFDAFGNTGSAMVDKAVADIEAARKATEDGLKAQQDAVWAGAEAWVNAYLTTAPEVGTAVTDIAVLPRRAIEAEWAALKAAAYQSQVEIAKGLIDGQNEPKVAMDAAMQLLENELTEAEEMARLEGQRITLQAAAGLASQQGKDAAYIALNAALDLVLRRMAEIKSSAYTGGYNIGVAWANGLRSSADYAKLMAWEVAASVNPALHGRSPPKEGPLSDIDVGGANIGKTWIKALAGGAIDNLRDLIGATSAVHQALMLDPGAFSASATVAALQRGGAVGGTAPGDVGPSAGYPRNSSVSHAFAPVINLTVNGGDPAEVQAVVQRELRNQLLRWETG